MNFTVARPAQDGVETEAEQSALKAPMVSHEDLALLQFHKDKAVREAQCDQAIIMAIQEIAAQYSCDIKTMFRYGNGLIPTTEFTHLPVALKSVAR